MKKTLLFLIFPLLSFGQWNQVGSVLEAENANDQFGTSVAINSAGNIIAVGAPLNNGTGAKPDSGHVRVFEDVGGVWTQIGIDINGEHIDDRSGSSIALNAMGDIVAIGSPNNDDSGNNAGQVRVYQNSGGTWTQLGSDINGGAANDNFGTSVSINDAGTILAVGSNNNGDVKVYQYQTGSWVQIGATIAESLDISLSVSLDATGNWLAIGYPYSDVVKVFENVANIWTERANIVGDEYDEFGTSVSLSNDGLTLIIGAPYDEYDGSYDGYARIYRNSGGTWSQVGSDIDGVWAGDEFGVSVSISANGSMVAIGTPYFWDDNISWHIGKIRVYEDMGGNWTQVGDDIRDPNVDWAADEGRFGRSVALSANGGIVVGGMHLSPDSQNYSSGEVAVFNNGAVLNVLDNSFAQDIKMFPNPSNGISFLEFGEVLENGDLTIYDLQGRLIRQFSFENKSRMEIDTTLFHSGTYLVQLTSGHRKGIFRLTVR